MTTWMIVLIVVAVVAVFLFSVTRERFQRKSKIVGVIPAERSGFNCPSCGTSIDVFLMEDGTVKCAHAPAGLQTDRPCRAGKGITPDAPMRERFAVLLSEMGIQ